MTSQDAIKVIIGCLKKELIIAANGFISRDVYYLGDRPGNFYMLGSMGLASSIGLGLAISMPKRKVIILDGDGNILMNLGSLATVGNKMCKNFIHIVLDNGMYESTGGQISGSETIALEKIAHDCGFKHWAKVKNQNGLVSCMTRLLKLKGPTFIIVKVSPRRGKISARLPLSPIVIKQRFRKAAEV